MKIIKIFSILLIITTSSFSNGITDPMVCLKCHGAHFAMDKRYFTIKDTKMINPLNGESLKELHASKCLSCHQIKEFGGIGVMPIHLGTSHPIGMIPNPRIADVPESRLNKGKLDCISCHKMDASNRNFMYLQEDTKGGKDIDKSCVVCHSVKADMKKREKLNKKDISSIQIFQK